MHSLIFLILLAQAHVHHHASSTTPGETARVFDIPDVAVVTHDGRRVRFHSDLVAGRLVAVNFIFTTCTTVCPVMGARTARLQSLLGDRASDVSIISISIDPKNDTPERLAAWSRRFHAKPGWTLVTGEKGEIDRLLRAFGVATADPASHTPLLLIGDGKGDWERVDGLAEPSRVVAILEPRMPKRSASTPEPKPGTAGSYLRDLPLVDQNGRSVELYSLMKDRTAVINSFFASCSGSCPVMANAFGAIQAEYRERIGRDLVLVSITVDPEHDTPARLREYAKRMKAGDGWFFLSGSKEQVDRALRKLGHSVETREQHQNIFLIGNDRTGLWKKAFGLAKPAELLEVVRSVVDDRGVPAAGGH